MPVIFGSTRGKRSCKIIRSARRIRDKILTPAVKRVAPWIRKVVMYKCLEQAIGGIVAIDTSMSISNGSTWGFNLGYMKGAFVKIKTAAWTPGKSPNRMMRIAGIKPAEEDVADVGFAIAVGIFEKHEIGFLCDISTSVAKFKSGR